MNLSTNAPAGPEVITQAMYRWIDKVVIDMNLCPFAAGVRHNGALTIRIADTCDLEAILQQVVDISSGLVERQNDSPIAAQATSLFVLPQGFDDFNDYLYLLALAEALLDLSGLRGQVQLASFHPQYRFADTPEADPANYTNRSPYPTLHILQESAVSRVLEGYPDAEQIPQRNVQALRDLDPHAARAFLPFCQPE